MKQIFNSTVSRKTVYLTDNDIYILDMFLDIRGSMNKIINFERKAVFFLVN